MIPYGDKSPLVINWGDSEEDQFTPVISSKAEVTYFYTGTEVPNPELFIDIEEDEWLLVVSKLPDNATPVLFWKGFITPSSNRYPWLSAPFNYTIHAVDFSFSKGKAVDLDDENLFLYDFITLGNFFKRSLFHSVGYDDSILKILFRIKPAVIGGGQITDSLFIHTDSLFDFTDGAMTCYDALQKVLSSSGTRVLYSAGSYWVQRIQDLNEDIQDIITITPDDTTGVETTNFDVQRALGNSVSDSVSYLNRSQFLIVNPALKKQTVNYNLKSINRVKNFDWRSGGPGAYDFWTGVNTGVYTRLGGGSLDDPYRILVPPPVGATLYQGIDIIPGKRVSVELKVRGFLTLPAPSSVNYQVSAKCVVLATNTGLLAGYILSQDGTWKEYGPGIGGVDESDYYYISTKGNGDYGTLEITSGPLPDPSLTGLQITIFIVESSISPAPPSGSNYYTHFYPVYLSIFNNEYIKVREEIVNTKVYSLTPPAKERFYLDQSDDGLSNCIFYSDAGTMRALPQNDWAGKTIDETVLRGELDQQNKPGYSFDGDIYSNDLSFHHVVTLTDFNNKKMMLLRDKYDVMSCVHSIYATEIMPIGSGIGTYTVTPLTKKED
jgi:hypothetical protein